MNAAKTTSERVEKLRQEREALGLRRRELYAHDDDWPKLQESAAKMQRKRLRLGKLPSCASCFDAVGLSPSSCQRWKNLRPRASVSTP